MGLCNSRSLKFLSLKLTRMAIQSDYSWGLLSFLLLTNIKVSSFLPWNWKGLHLLKSPLGGTPGPAWLCVTSTPRQGRGIKGGLVHMCVLVFLTRIFLPWSKSLHLHSIPLFYSTLPHSSSPKLTPPASSSPSSIVVDMLKVDLSFLFYPPSLILISNNPATLSPPQ